jgi:hypothetical protein
MRREDTGVIQTGLELLTLNFSMNMKQWLLFVSLSSLESLEKYHLPRKTVVGLNGILCKSTWHIVRAQ